ncbi:sensor histidine kinase [Actinoplanes xinjiangensis]|uniref:Anti-sigma regulatory factor (Ser/Thr protein kinase) n=1 Tax=Actinoplanes xinjiangensis TaxID=512350 RepID=A0A316FIP5_9ACTN|nr:sensor histidine kinase [Actinoplanes xinjiangensis]PWK48359.1 anti-sigma regulatory factor (Ser/Thr protein kinase) [Actinoplanes xinjiangensis]GIF38886.1 anti-sigma regulatory factor [Actinoplanes xinjiangensis]
MRTGAAAGHTGYFHEALCYDSDDHLLAVAVPFLLGGVAAGEPTLVGLGGRTADLVRAALPAGAPVTFLAGGAVYARPAGAIRSYRELLAGHVAAGAAQIRIIGELPVAALGVTWDWWARYESAINHAYDEFPLWSMCAYDTRVTPAPVLADVLRTYPRTALPDGRHVPNNGYIDPVSYLSEPRAPVPDPVQRAAPHADLVDPTLSAARQAVRDADPGVLPDQDVDDLIVSVSEAVANAQRHGRGPVRMRLWRGADRIVVTVRDTGGGPKDPFAGLLPAGDGTAGGLGLWIAHQSCSHVALHRRDDGFTIRLTAGNPHH